MTSDRVSGLALAVVLVIGATAGPDALAAEALAAERPPTFTRDIAPILQEKCEVCHRPDNIGPMSLRTYEEVRPWARSIRGRVLSRDMPPWHLDKDVGIQQFINDRSLSDQQIETIVKWVDAGAARGDADDMPTPKQWPSGDRFFLEDLLGPPDLVVRSKPWTMPAQGPDVKLEVAVDVPELTEPRWVRASETKPSLRGRRIAHHANSYLLRPQTAEAIAAERAVRAGQPGADLVIAGRRERPHYGTGTVHRMGSGEGGRGLSGKRGQAGDARHESRLLDSLPRGRRRNHRHAGSGLVVPSEGGDAQVQRGMDVGGRRELRVAPDSTQYGHAAPGKQGAPGAAILHNFQPHMHYRGRAQTLEAIYPDGRREVINQVSRFTNSWHINYIYDPDYAPVFPKGTVLLVTHVHDNTAANRNNPDPRQWVSEGARTVDEMAHLNEQVIYITEENYRQILEERKKRASTQN